MSRSTTWSPVDCLPGAKLTESGLLELERQEVFLWTRDQIELRAAQANEALPALTFAGNLANTTGKTWVDRSENLTVTLTTHRVVLQLPQSSSSSSALGGSAVTGLESSVSKSPSTVQARFLHMSTLMGEPQLETALFKSPKILLHSVLGDLILIFRGDKASGNAKDALQFLQSALRRKEWENETKLQKMEDETRNTKKVGVDAILARSAARHQQAATVTQQAFTGDAETLLQEAAALVSIIQKYVATLDKHESTGDAEDNDRLAAMLENMGMTAALRKTDFKGREDAYYAQLARQLADFLRPKLKNSMMTLTDVYCLYNRARGSNLISPEDLLMAVDQLEKLPLGLSHRQFPSGLRVLQDAALREDVQAENLQTIAKEGVTAIQASRELNVSVLIAQEQLQAAERHGALVRDETTESLRFFPNRFGEWIAQ